MHRLYALATLAALLTATPAHAQDIERILKGDTRQPDRVEINEDGLSKLVFNLTESELAAAGLSTRAKTVFSYITYTRISRPSLIGGITALDVAPLEFARYFYALIVTNFGGADHRGTVKFDVKGPVKWKRTFPNQTADGGSIVVFFFQADALDKIGNYLLSASMTKAGKMKSRFCAGC